ncbi:hypothetical protein ES695_20255 [Candidatus Atribacteria bacterium 1244-E10-H5-B2]|nr:MAG: hypothetical protein ES695_20255 [Candidatus Atribacteria bacterium 1244-E10-H5-B2]
MINIKRCGKCQKTKSLNEFYKHKREKDGLECWCKKCCYEYRKDWIKNNSIKYWCKRTIESHKERGHKVLFKKEDILPLAKLTKRCSICNIKLNWNLGNRNTPRLNSPTLDRKNNGNILELKSIWIICRRCNQTKSNRNMEELYKWCETFVEKYKTLWARGL